MAQPGETNDRWKESKTDLKKQIQYNKSTNERYREVLLQSLW
jgi:hypothetical protein